VWTGEATYAGLDDLTDVIARLVIEPEMIGARTRVNVELEKPLVQYRILSELPAVSAEALRQIVEQQAHRYFRKNGKPLIVDAFRENGKNSPVHAAAVEEPIVAAIGAGVRAAGFRLAAIAPSSHPGRLSLEMPEERVRRQREARLSLRRLAFAVALLWLLAVCATVFNVLRQRRAIDRELADLAKPVAALAAVKREMAIAKSMIVAINRDARRQHGTLGLIASITAALPDSAFLTSLTIEDGDRGFLGGYSRRASEVLARLESAGVLATPRLDGQLGREIIGGVEWERFSITFGKEGRE
jgi:hypothetical protein